MRRLAWLVVAAAVATGAIAAADEEGERILLDYHALEGCPDAATFKARVQAQKTRVRFVHEGQTRLFEVRIDAGPPFSGELVVRRGDVVEGTRRVHAETCAEVADALVFMAGLAIDPSAILQAEAVPTAPSAMASPAPPGSALPTANEPPASAPQTSSVAAAPAPQAEEAPLALVPTPPRTLYVGSDVAFAMAVSPRTIVALSPYAGWRSASDGLFAMGVRVAFLYGTTGSVEAAGGAASFTWVVGRADGCGLSWPPGPAHLLACVRVEAGTLEGAGTVVPAAQSRTRGWLAAGPLLRAEWMPIGTIFLDADVAAMVHVTHDRFYFPPDSTVYAVPLGGLEAAGGLGVHFL